MNLYSIRIWGKKSQTDFISFECFSDCIPFAINEDYCFDFPTREQNAFMQYLIELIHKNEEFETEFDFNQFWLKSVLDIYFVLVVDITSNYPRITNKELSETV